MIKQHHSSINCHVDHVATIHIIKDNLISDSVSYFLYLLQLLAVVNILVNKPQKDIIIKSWSGNMNMPVDTRQENVA